MGNRLCALLTVPAFKSRASSGYAAENIRIGGEGKESNLPSPTRRDKPVLKTGGATGPLPSPLGRPDVQRSGSFDACKVRHPAACCPEDSTPSGGQPPRCD